MNLERWKYFGMLAVTTIALNSVALNSARAGEDPNFSFEAGCDEHDYIGDNFERIREFHPYYHIGAENLSRDADYSLSVMNITRRVSLTEVHTGLRHGTLSIMLHSGVPNLNGRLISINSGDQLMINIHGSDGIIARDSVRLPIC